MKVEDKIKKNASAKVEVKTSSIISHGSDKTKKVEVKQDKPKGITETVDTYHIETGSLASQVITYINNHNRKNIDIRMKDIDNHFGNTFYSIFCRLQERSLAWREGKFLHVINADSKKAQAILSVCIPRIGANDEIKEDEQKRISKVLVEFEKVKK